MATQLSRTFSSQGNQRKFTISVWVKRSKIGATQSIMGSGGNGSYATHMYIDSNDVIDFWNWFNSAYQGRKITNRKFRDTHGFYHIVFRVDTTSATASERMRLYVNGVEETSFATNDAPSQNQTFEIGHTGAHYIGGYGSGANYEGYMSHFHYCDGQSYAPTEFGETDSTTGIWKPKTSPSVSYGTSGVFLDFADSSAMGNDVSGLNNDWTADSTLKQTIDTPSNVFATLNSITPNSNNLQFGGLRFKNNSGVHDMRISTLAASQGRWYAEVKVTEIGGNYPQIGIINPDKFDDYDYLGSSDAGYAYLSNGNKQYNNSATSFGNTYTTGDIIGIAMDLDNHKLYFAKNGTWQNSGDPTSGATGTGSAYDLVQNVFYSFGGSSSDAGTDPIHDWNFGNGYFGTTAVSSAGTNAGIGTFEYDVPSGYKALCTKNINAEEYS